MVNDLVIFMAICRKLKKKNVSFYALIGLGEATRCIHTQIELLPSWESRPDAQEPRISIHSHPKEE